MSIKVIDGNIFTSKCETLVNTVNCVGIMGAGIALEFRMRYPQMYEKYVDLCNQGKIDIGMLWIYTVTNKTILNFPTKKHWKYPSKKEYLHAGLKKFCDSYVDKGIKSIAFPLLGADKGGIPQSESLEIILQYLNALDLDIEIYRYDPTAKDDLYEKTKQLLLKKSINELISQTNIKENQIKKILLAVNSNEICQLNQLARVPGVGIKSLESIYKFAMSEGEKTIKNQPIQLTLF